MTSCERVRELLPGYHLVTLEAEDRSAVEHHLGGCLACVRELVAWKRAFEVDEVPSPPAGLRARVRAAVLSECAPRFGPFARWEQPLAVAVAAGLIVVAETLTTLLTGGEGAPPRGLGRAAAVACADRPSPTARNVAVARGGRSSAARRSSAHGVRAPHPGTPCSVRALGSRDTTTTCAALGPYRRGDDSPFPPFEGPLPGRSTRGGTAVGSSVPTSTSNSSVPDRAVTETTRSPVIPAPSPPVSTRPPSVTSP